MKFHDCLIFILCVFIAVWSYLSTINTNGRLARIEKYFCEQSLANNEPTTHLECKND